ncbi:cytidyltransferase [Baekduia soli]|uniref:Cytidyltransferase n=1 Tax=Baekduia soli TaxID=496014 RepID=A0A5B8U1U7_9ACTN|nr:cytidyltransferase [Baekduia soli]QEC46912.1 cytidyltransferase [Baekduia soli]
MSALACVTGRFQPPHAQHLELFAIALRDAERLVVAVTNPDSAARRPEPASAHRHTPAANPFTYFERAGLLGAALEAEGLGPRTTIVPFDLTRPATWPEYVPLHARQYVRAYGDWERDKAAALAVAGYAVTVLEGDPAGRLSASDLRVLLAGGDEAWRAAVPPATVGLLAELLQAFPMAQRGGG